MNKLNCCFFCLNSISDCDKTAKSLNYVRRFFQLVLRHLISDSSLPSEHVLLNSLISQVNKKIHIYPCSECLQQLNKFNELYGQMKDMELQTNWALFKLGNKMGHAGQVPAKLLRFRNNLGVTYSREKSCTGIPTAEALSWLRHELQLKCKSQIDKQSPRVALNELETSEPMIIIKTEESEQEYKNRNDHNWELKSNHNLRQTAVDDILKIIASLKIVCELALIDVNNILKGHTQEKRNIKTCTISDMSYKMNNSKDEVVAQTTIQKQIIQNNHEHVQSQEKAINNIKIEPIGESDISKNENNENVDTLIEKQVINKCELLKTCSSVKSEHLDVEKEEIDTKKKTQVDMFSCHRCLQKFENFSSLKYHWITCSLKPKEENSVTQENSIKNEAVDSICQGDGSMTQFLEKIKSDTQEISKEVDSNITNCDNTCNSDNDNCHLIKRKKCTEEFPKIKIKEDTEHKCGLCPYSCVLKCHMTRHLSFHKKFQKSCSICNYPIGSPSHLHDHMARAHKVQELSKQSSQATVKISVEKCAPVAKKFKEINRHHHKHQKVIKYKCDKCPLTILSYSGFWRHLQLHKKCTQNCSLCNYPIFSNYQLKDHISRKHSVENGNKLKGIGQKKTKFVCKKCHTTYSSLQKLKQHQLTHSNPATWKHSCSVCGQRFFAKHKLQLHVLSHRLTKSGKTSQPTKKSSSSQSTKYICKKCGKICHILATYQYHMMTHAPPASWKHVCSVCKKRFIWLCHLKSHMNCHLKQT